MQSLTIHEVPQTEWPIRVGLDYRSRNHSEVYARVLQADSSGKVMYDCRHDVSENDVPNIGRISPETFRERYHPNESASLPKHMELLARAFCALDEGQFPKLRAEILEMLKPMGLEERLRISAQTEG